MKKAKFKINNKMKPYGMTDTSSGVVQINVKKHKGDRRQLADTIKHELIHVKHPKMHEKAVYKKTKPELSKATEDKLIAKLRMKQINYKIGAGKRKYKLKSPEPGALITKYNEAKSKARLAIMGLV